MRTMMYGQQGFGGYGHAFVPHPELGMLCGLFTLLFIGLAVLFVLVVARRMRHHKAWHGCSFGCHSDPAFQLLKERFVKGDISKEEFIEKKKVLLG